MADFQKRIETNAGLLIFGILLVSSVGGLAQILPVLYQPFLATASAGIVPPGPLALAGRGIYIRESCSLCHSQQIRPLLAEVKRYGPPAHPGEFVYERPFLWGSKRTGPDLQRVGGIYSDAWHVLHLRDPRAVVPTSIMPAYPWLEASPVDAAAIQARMRALQALGHPYDDRDIAGAAAALEGKTEMDAIVAYLQSLGASGP